MSRSPCVALLKGVNVGRGRRVPMADFKAVLEGLGCTAVRTLLNSGNAVFHSPARPTALQAEDIRAALQDRLGLQVPTLLKSAEVWAAIVAGIPWTVPEAEQSRLLIAVGPDAASLAALAPLQQLLQGDDRFALGPQAAYLHCPGGLLDSPAAAALLGPLGRHITTRNLATARKLAALLQDLPAGTA